MGQFVNVVVSGSTISLNEYIDRRNKNEHAASLRARFHKCVTRRICERTRVNVHSSTFIGIQNDRLGINLGTRQVLEAARSQALRFSGQTISSLNVIAGNDQLSSQSESVEIDTVRAAELNSISRKAIQTIPKIIQCGYCGNRLHNRNQCPTRNANI
ncbi:hypothetical protein GJ496_005004 [Pomphorhynchus laevis]|nr:hypothetical protein GJ496_005004 [Pomphorhynchus laevis]